MNFAKVSLSVCILISGCTPALKFVVFNNTNSSVTLGLCLAKYEIPAGEYAEIFNVLCGEAPNIRIGDIAFHYGAGFLDYPLEKKYGEFLTGFLNMDWASIRNSEFGWDQHRHPESSQIIRDPANVQELRIIAAYTDAILVTPGTYGAKLNLALHTPANYGGGPDILGAKPLGLWNVQLLHTWRQGSLFTWNPNSLASLENALNFRYKDFHETNLRVEKMFRFSGVTAAVYGEIWNLFNVKNGHDTDGFASRADNGLGGSTGPNARAYAEALGIDANGGSQSKSWGSEPDDANSHLIQRPYIFWLSPRDVWFGLRFFF